MSRIYVGGGGVRSRQHESTTATVAEAAKAAQPAIRKHERKQLVARCLRLQLPVAPAETYMKRHVLHDYRRAPGDFLDIRRINHYLHPHSHHHHQPEHPPIASCPS